jgi:hypothetical protein
MASTFTDGVTCQSGFGRDAGDAHSLIDVSAQPVHNRNDMKDSRTAQADVAAHAQHRHFLPLVRDLNRKQQVNTHYDTTEQRSAIAKRGHKNQAAGD